MGTKRLELSPAGTRELRLIYHNALWSSKPVWGCNKSWVGSTPTPSRHPILPQENKDILEAFLMLMPNVHSVQP